MLLDLCCPSVLHSITGSLALELFVLECFNSLPLDLLNVSRLPPHHERTLIRIFKDAPIVLITRDFSDSAPAPQLGPLVVVNPFICSISLDFALFRRLIPR